MILFSTRTAMVLAAAVSLTAAGAFALHSSDAPPAAEAPVAAAEAATPTKIAVYKSPTCGCCTKWEDHLREAGFDVESHATNEMAAIKVANGVPGALASCHTAVVGGYTIEGHVPADLIRRLLEERPKVAGLAVPGMPMGSPGMEGTRKDAYDVLTFDETGRAKVFARR